MRIVLDLLQGGSFFLFLLFVFSSCGNDGEQSTQVYQESRVMSSYSDGRPQILLYIVDSLKDSVVIETLTENGSPLNRYSMLEGEKHGVFQAFHENGELKYSTMYSWGYKTGDYFLYNDEGYLLQKIVYYEDEAVYKEYVTYDNDKEIDSIHTYLGLIIDNNRPKITDPFFTNSYSALGIKFPHDKAKGHLYIRYALMEIDSSFQHIPKFLPDSISISNDNFTELGYTFYEEGRYAIIADIYERTTDTTVVLGTVMKEFDVVDSFKYVNSYSNNI